MKIPLVCKDMNRVGPTAVELCLKGAGGSTFKENSVKTRQLSCNMKL